MPRFKLDIYFKVKNKTNSWGQIKWVFHGVRKSLTMMEVCAGTLSFAIFFLLLVRTCFITTIFQTSRTGYLRSSWIISRSFATFTSEKSVTFLLIIFVNYVHGDIVPECLSSSSDSLSSLIRRNLSNIIFCLQSWHVSIANTVVQP